MCKACIEGYSTIEWLLGAEGVQRGMEWLLVTIDLVGDNWEFK